MCVYDEHVRKCRGFQRPEVSEVLRALYAVGHEPVWVLVTELGSAARLWADHGHS